MVRHVRRGLGRLRLPGQDYYLWLATDREVLIGSTRRDLPGKPNWWLPAWEPLTRAEAETLRAQVTTEHGDYPDRRVYVPCTDPDDPEVREHSGPGVAGLLLAQFGVEVARAASALRAKAVVA